MLRKCYILRLLFLCSNVMMVKDYKREFMKVVFIEKLQLSTAE